MEFYEHPVNNIISIGQIRITSGHVLSCDNPIYGHQQIIEFRQGIDIYIYRNLPREEYHYIHKKMSTHNGNSSREVKNLEPTPELP